MSFTKLLALNLLLNKELGAVQQGGDKTQIKGIGVVQGHAHIAHIIFSIVQDGGGHNPHIKHLFPRDLDPLGGSGGPRSEDNYAGPLLLQGRGAEIPTGAHFQHLPYGGHMGGMIPLLPLPCDHIPGIEG